MISFYMMGITMLLHSSVKEDAYRHIMTNKKVKLRKILSRLLWNNCCQFWITCRIQMWSIGIWNWKMWFSWKIRQKETRVFNSKLLISVLLYTFENIKKTNQDLLAPSFISHPSSREAFSHKNVIFGAQV